MTESKKQKKLGLGGRILIGIVIGLAIGFISPSLASALSPLGTIFLRLLKMIMVPLVFFSITSGVCKMGDIKQLASVGLRFVLYILFTSGLASAVGVIVGLIFQPGKGTTEFLDASANVESVTYNFIDNVVSWVPDNVVNAMATANMLQVIVFALFLGVALLSLGEKAKVFTSFIDQGSDVMLKIVEYIMAVSPIGIASLMATMVSTISGATMKEVVSFIIMDYGCGITILLIVYPLLIKLLARVPVISFMKKISEPMFVCCIFASNLYGMPVTVASLAQFIFLGIILSVGAAGVKGAGIVMSTVLLEAIGMPLTLIPILAAIWPAIDPIHTLMNNTSDLVGTMLIARQLDKVDMNVYNS